MGTIQQLLGIHSLIKIAASWNKIVVPKNMLALLPSMNAAGYVVQRRTSGFCTNCIARRKIRCPRAQRQTWCGFPAGDTQTMLTRRIKWPRRGFWLHHLRAQNQPGQQQQAQPEKRVLTIQGFHGHRA